MQYYGPELDKFMKKTSFYTKNYSDWLKLAKI